MELLRKSISLVSSYSRIYLLCGYSFDVQLLPNFLSCYIHFEGNRGEKCQLGFFFLEFSFLLRFIVYAIFEELDFLGFFDVLMHFELAYL